MLFDRCRIGGIDAACPIVRSATFEGMADAQGYPTDKLAQMYERLADGGVGVMIRGMMAVSTLEPRQHRQIRIDDDSCVAPRAKEAGFDGVQFHSAHGYLASKFLSPYFNRREDEYGGSLENRARFLLECIASIRKHVGPEYPVWVKINSEDFMKEGGMTFDESLQVMEWLADAKVSAIEVSGGNMSSLPRKGPIRAIRRTKEPMYPAPAASAPKTWTAFSINKKRPDR